MNTKEQTRLRVLTMVIEGMCTAREAAELVQLSERQVLRLKKGLREQGPAAFAHGNRGRRPRHAIAEELRKEVIELATSLYRDYNHTHLQEELEERHGVSLSRRSVTRILTAVVHQGRIIARQPAASTSPLRARSKRNDRSNRDYIEPPKAAPTKQKTPDPAKHKPPATHPWRTLMLAGNRKHNDKFTGQLT